MNCLFAVLFQREEAFKPLRLPRRAIVEFIRGGKYFTKEPRCKPSAKSAEMAAGNWLTFELRPLSAQIPMEIRWAQWNYGAEYSVEPLKHMALGMILDTGTASAAAWSKSIEAVTDAIWVNAVASDLDDASRGMLADLRTFLIQKTGGVLFVPGQGLFRGTEELLFPENICRPASTMVFGKKWGHYTLAASADGKTLATAGDPGSKARLWDAETGAELRVFTGHKKPTRAVAIAPDGQTVASSGHDRTIILWDATTGAARTVLPGVGGIVASLAFSPDGRLLASGGYDGSLILWKLPEGRPLRTSQPHGLNVIGIKDGEKWHSSKGTPASICSVAFSPDGTLLASGGTDGTVRLCNVFAGHEVRTFEGYAESAWPVVFSPDGSLLAAGSYDRTVRLWNTQNGNLAGTIAGHAHYVFALAFSADGKQLATGSNDTLIRLWDIKSRQRLCTFHGHVDAIGSVAFLTDGKRLASAGEDGTIRIWPLDKRAR